MPSYRELFAATESSLATADVWCGHGYIDHHDEAIALVLAAAARPLDTGPEILDQVVPDSAVARLQEFLQARVKQRLPVAYIIGEAWLGPYIFRSDSRALVPRSPIAELVLNRFRPWWIDEAAPRCIVDVCCGGGSLGLLAAHQFPEAQVLLMDIDAQALALAEENIALHQLTGSVRAMQADLLAPLGADSADVILANPPYVDGEDMAALPPEYTHEPRHALAAGDDGLDLVHDLLAQAARVLTGDGVLFLEVGNSWAALEAAYPRFEFVWLEMENGGHGVAVFSKNDLSRLVAMEHQSMQE